MTLVDYPGHFAAGVAALIAAVLLFSAYRTAKVRSLGILRLVLAVLQYGIILILLIIIWNPARATVTQSTSKNIVLAVFDTSGSMSIGDGGKKNRLDQAVGIFTSRFAPGREDRPHYKIFNFDALCNYCDSLKTLPRWGQKTNLLSVMNLLSRYDAAATKVDSLDNQKVVGAVIFTDGQADNKNVSAYLARRKDSSLQVILVGMGTTDLHCDIVIKSIKAPARVAIDTSYKIQVSVQGRELSATPIKIELRKDESLIDVKEFSALQDEQEHTIEFVIGADKLGQHCLEVTAATLKDEINRANNVRRATVNVVEPEKLKVLLYTQVANLDFGKIRSSLERSKKIQLDVGLDAVVSPRIARMDKSMAGHIELPKDKAGFYQYDLIILGPCSLDHLNSAQIEGLYSFVTERGGGLILLPGREAYNLAFAKNQTIKALLPVEFKSNYTGSAISDKSRVQLTPEGIDSKILTKLDLKKLSDKIAPFYSHLYKKPAATILANSDDVPILCVHRIGRGRVCLINAYGLFRWYREDLDGGLLRKVMTGLADYLPRVTKAQAGIELFAKRLTDNARKIKFDAYVYNQQFSLVSDATVLLEVAGEVLQMDQSDLGHYVAEIDNLPDQAVIATAEAQIKGVHLGRKTLTANLPLPLGEMDRTELDRQFLQELAQRINAEYFDADQIDKYSADIFEPTSPVKTISDMQSVWQEWSLLICLCVLLTVVWFVRRAKGLI